MTPTQDNQFYMKFIMININEFQESIALKYGRSPINGCSQPILIDISHRINWCQAQLHLINLSGLTETVKEPVLKEPNQDGNN